MGNAGIAPLADMAARKTGFGAQRLRYHDTISPAKTPADTRFVSVFAATQPTQNRSDGWRWHVGEKFALLLDSVPRRAVGVTLLLPSDLGVLGHVRHR